MGVSLLAVAAVSLWALATGPTPIAWTSIAHDILHLGPPRLTGINRFFINDLRAPRVVLGLLAGATLATAGATYQGVFRNPLADPYLLGVAAGAGLGATVALVGVNGWIAPAGAVTWFAFVGALSSVALTWLVGGPTDQLRIAGMIALSDPPRADSKSLIADLRARNPVWGLRRLAAVLAEAEKSGLRLRKRVAMPANNLLLALERAPTAPN